MNLVNNEPQVYYMNLGVDDIHDRYMNQKTDEQKMSETLTEEDMKICIVFYRNYDRCHHVGWCFNAKEANEVCEKLNDKHNAHTVDNGHYYDILSGGFSHLFR